MRFETILPHMTALLCGVTMTPRQRLLALLSERPADACNVEVLYHGTNIYRTVTLKAGDGFTNYNFRTGVWREFGATAPSARVQQREHAEWFAGQPQFEVRLIPDEGR